MKAFGKQWNVSDVPGIVLLLSIPLILIWRETSGIYIYSAAVRLIPMTAALFLCILFRLTLSKPAHQHTTTSTQLLVIAFLVSATISTAIGNFELGYSRLVELIILALFSLFLFAYLNENEKFKKPILISVTGLTWICLFTYLELWFSLDEPSKYNWSNGILPFFNHIRHLDYLLCLSTPIAYILWQSESSTSKIYAFTVEL